MKDERIFTHDRWEELFKQTIIQLSRLATLKGGEYSGDTDRLANFRRNAEGLGLDYRQVWAVYAGKHWDAIIQSVKDIASNTERTRMESLAGRCDDLMVYLLLFKAMLAEQGQDRGHEVYTKTGGEAK